MKSIIDEALETGHNRFDRKAAGGRDKEHEDAQEENRNLRNLPIMRVTDPVEREEGVEELEVAQDLKDDYTHARKISLGLLEQQQELIKSMANFLNAAPSPRAYEVMNQMMKTAMEMSKDLLGLQSQLNEAKGEKASGGEGKGGDTFIFNANGPSEILKKLEEAAEAEKKVIDITPDDQ